MPDLSAMTLIIGAWVLTVLGHADVGICVLGTMIAVNGQQWRKGSKR